MGPLSINATALNAFDIQVSWDPVQQLSANGLLRGYEVGPNLVLGFPSGLLLTLTLAILHLQLLSKLTVEGLSDQHLHQVERGDNRRSSFRSYLIDFFGTGTRRDVFHSTGTLS